MGVLYVVNTLYMRRLASNNYKRMFLYEYYNVFPLYFCYHYMKRTTTLCLQSFKYKVPLPFTKPQKLNNTLYILYLVFVVSNREKRFILFFQDVVCKKMSVHGLERLYELYKHSR